jgi:hypothetical protein
LKKLSEYLAHAAECREMARTASAGRREQLENMADTWEQLAESGRRKLRSLGKTEDDGADLNC